MINEYHSKMSIFGEKIQDYEVLEHLGRGGFANVYRAKCLSTGLFVAIKMIDKARMANAGMIGRVRQEVTIHSRLKHPAILELYTFFEDVHYVYLVLELAHNGELAKHFKLGTHGLSEKAAADIFKQVLNGVLYLHTHNIIHRDLSLNNLLLTKDLKVKIADFGLATQLNAPDEKHVTMCGTPNYISPEVASRELHGLPVDVWGLGCMLYTLLVGSPPFHTENVKSTLNKVINADFKIPAGLSIYAQELLQKMLCKDPTRRISLKDIVEDPFLNHSFGITPLIKQEMSRDSGFLTTLHSTQHSTKLKFEKSGPDCFSPSCSNQPVQFVNRDEFARLSPYNVFSGVSENMFYSNTKQGNVSGTLSNQDYVQSCEIVSGNLKKLDITKIRCDSGNKENIPKALQPQTSTIGVPPLCADRLPFISHRTRNAMLKINVTGVIVEFLKRKGKNREEKVVEICTISKDGMKIVISTIDKVTDTEPNLNEYFTYHNLPQKHWKKYLYASRFVDLVKSKTPKITLYSSLAKCQLMENGTDIDMFFYGGEKITSSATDGLRVIDKHLKTHNKLTSSLEVKSFIEHFEECSNRMKRILSALSCVSDECFPLIIGKRPPGTTQNRPELSSPSCQDMQNYPTPTFNIGSFHRAAGSSTQTTDYI